MKFSKVCIAALCAAGAVAFSSCDNNDNTDTILQYNFAQCYAVVTDANSIEPEAMPGVSVVLQANWSKGTAESIVTGLNIGGSIYPAIALTEQKFKLENNGTWGVITGGKGQLNTGQTAFIEDYSLEWTDRAELVPTVSREYDPALYFKFNLDGRYTVAGARQPFIMGGSTTSTPVNGQGYTSDKSLYVISLDFSTKLAKIKVSNANFAQGMPSINMEFPGIPFKVNADASVVLDCKSLTPTIADVPQPNYPIVDLHAEIIPGRATSTLEFACNFRGQMRFDVKASIKSDGYAGYFETVE